MTKGKKPGNEKEQLMNERLVYWDCVSGLAGRTELRILVQKD